MKRVLSILIAVGVLLLCGVAQAGPTTSLGPSKFSPQMVPHEMFLLHPWGHYAATGGFSNDPKDYNVVVNSVIGPDEHGLYEVAIRGQVPSGVYIVGMLIRTILTNDEPFLYPGAPEGAPGWRILDDTVCNVMGSEFLCKHRTVPAIFFEGNLNGVRVEVMFFKRDGGGGGPSPISTIDYACSGAGGPMTCHWVDEGALDGILDEPHSPSLLSGTMPASIFTLPADLSSKAKQLIMKSPKPMKGEVMIVR